ncbi:MAG: ester cyclase [Euryarchaeota archaeon]|nr:ester cyclase [Euryarchaeota archaeon]
MKALVRGYLREILIDGRLEAWPRYFGPSLTFNGRAMDPQAFRALREGFFAALPDFTFRIEEQVAEGNTVVTRLTLAGTHEGRGFGLPPTGRRVSYAGIAFDRFAGGKIVEMRHFTDDAAVLRQLGAVPRLP